MALRTWLHCLTRLFSEFSFVRRRSMVVLWRLRQTSEEAEAVCSVTEPTPGVFHVVLTHKGECEVRRLVHGIDLLVSWSEGVKAGLQAEGWREVDVPKASRRIRRRTPNESHAIEIGAPDMRRGSQSP